MEVVKEFLESSTIHGLSHIQSAQVSVFCDLIIGAGLCLKIGCVGL